MSADLRILLTVLSLTSVIRGIDYMTGSEFVAARGWGEESTMPLLWGAASVGVGLYGLLAAAINCKRQAINVGLVGMSVSAMFAVQVFEMRMLPVPWPPQDARIVVHYIGQAVLWLLVTGTAYFRQGVSDRRHEIEDERRDGMLGGEDG